VLDRVRSELKSENLSLSRHRELLDEGIVANDQLLERLDETLSRIHAFRDEREASGVRLRDARRELAEEGESAGASSLSAQGAPQ
jgi:hypothetical protein